MVCMFIRNELVECAGPELEGNDWEARPVASGAEGGHLDGFSVYSAPVDEFFWLTG